ncbi:MAG: hypothetical protein Q9209_005717 [Squamulea sp. 1 TL-2023]
MCQLRRLHELIAPFLGTDGSTGQGHNVFIWLDTLCCPVEPPEAKRMALSQMHRPYRDAARVLVLDSSLQKVKSSRLHPTEICLRIFTSGWMRRMWTLQEGALARNLWFQFKHAPVNIKRLWIELCETYISDVGRRGLAFDAMSVYQGLRVFNRQETVLHGANLGISLSAVDYALRYRAVSVATDEPLLIGGLLNLDLTYILDGPESSRMERLWSLAPLVKRGIPKSVLFRSSPKLCQPGFRWAPATLLTFHEEPREELRIPVAEDEPGVLTAAGLRVHLAALPITIPSTAQSLPKNPWGIFNGETDDCMFCRYEDSTWLYVSRAHFARQVHRIDTKSPTLRSLLQNESKRYTLLLARPLNFDQSVEVTKALLVHDGGGPTRTVEISLDTMLTVNTKVGSLGVMLEGAYQASRTLLADKITQQFTDLAIEDESEQKQHPVYQNLVASLATKIRSMAENMDDAKVREAIEFNGRHGNAAALFQSLIVNAYLGHYGQLGRMLPSDTEWCVD